MSHLSSFSCMKWTFSRHEPLVLMIKLRWLLDRRIWWVNHNDHYLLQALKIYFPFVLASLPLPLKSSSWLPPSWLSKIFNYVVGATYPNPFPLECLLVTSTNICVSVEKHLVESFNLIDDGLHESWWRNSQTKMCYGLFMMWLLKSSF